MLDPYIESYLENVSESDLPLARWLSEMSGKAPVDDCFYIIRCAKNDPDLKSKLERPLNLLLTQLKLEHADVIARYKAAANAHAEEQRAEQKRREEYLRYRFEEERKTMLYAGEYQTIMNDFGMNPLLLEARRELLDAIDKIKKSTWYDLGPNEEKIVAFLNKTFALGIHKAGWFGKVWRVNPATYSALDDAHKSITKWLDPETLESVKSVIDYVGDRDGASQEVKNLREKLQRASETQIYNRMTFGGRITFRGHHTSF